MSVERTDPGEPTTSDGVMYCSGILGYEVGESSAAAAARPAGGLRADYGFVATIDREIRRDPERYVGYGITDSWDEIVETLQGAPVSTDIELGAHMRVFESMRGLGTSDGCCDLAHGGVISLRTTVHAQMSEITELQSADHRRQRGRFYDLLETDRRRHTTERDDSTSGTGHHTGGVVAGDSIYWECADITGAGALTWWNSHVMTVTHDVAYSMTWVDLKKKMTDKYCPRNEMKKLEAELWNLKNVPEEADKIERGTGNANNNNNQKGTGSGQKPTCFECGAQGHFKKECPRMKNNKGNRGNQAGNDRAPAKVYVVGNAGANPDNVCRLMPFGLTKHLLCLWTSEPSHVIDSEGIHVDPAKIESIKDWTSPKSPTEIHQFLGLAGYYRRFIEGFSKIAKPMTKLPKRWLSLNGAIKQEASFPTSPKRGNPRTLRVKTLGESLIEKRLNLQKQLEKKSWNPRADGTLCLQWLEWLPVIEAWDTVSSFANRGPRFASNFWRSLQNALGTNLDMSTAYHPQTDGQSERTIQTLEDMLRACAIDFGKGWVNHLPLVEFSYNNSYHASIKAAPFEALYGRKCRSPVCWTEVGEAQILGPELIQETTEKIIQIKQRMQAAS
ncbi:putative reverse transcriptase domain-containing protein [Tanacetum coccineum]